MLNPSSAKPLSLLLGTLLFSAAALADNPAQIKRGALLVDYGGCRDCHTPFKLGPKGPEKDATRDLSGHPAEMQLPPPPKLDGAWNWAGSATMTAFIGPWGTTYAGNLTPDKETGIGSWRVQDFVAAMRNGKHLGAGRPILPPMPWQSIGALPDSDLKAIFAYLKSRPAIRNRVPDYAPPTPPAARASGPGNAS